MFFDQRHEGTLTGGFYHAQVLAPGSWNTVSAVDPKLDERRRARLDASVAGRRLDDA